jgi:DNA (cytosine-5)-methyltransferase 1
MTSYYNEHHKFAADWLRNLIAAGHIAPGVVDERSIEDVLPSDLRGFSQCHFFAGIGGWPIALRQLRWADDRPVWTGSCPCQPFSAPGAGLGFADERHLWPAFFHLIQECRPAVVLGEQVSGKDVDPWIDLVQADVEALDYAFGAVPFPAAGIGSPQIRDRVYWLADAAGDRWGQEHPHVGRFVARVGAEGLTAGSLPGGACDWRLGLDGRRRPLEPGIEPVVDGFPGLLEQLRAYGNAVNVEAAKLLIGTFMEAA